MRWWDKRAGDLQRDVKQGEGAAGSVLGIRSPGAIVYEDDDIKTAIVHARQDIVLLVSYLSSVNQQLSTIKYLLAAVIIGLALVGLSAIH